MIARENINLKRMDEQSQTKNYEQEAQNLERMEAELLKKL